MNRNTIRPMGYLADNWFGANEDNPALIVNPDASPLDLLAWAGGELNSIEAAGDTLARIASGDSQMSVADFCAIFLHRIAPVARVLDVALTELVEQRNQAAAAALGQLKGVRHG